MRKRILLILLLLPLVATLFGQSGLSINGLNEAELIYRMAEDSLNVYFKDSFAFNLAYRNFRFGMKFIGELPKYSNQQSELMQELDSNRMDLGWKELYAQFQKDAFSLHAGTTEESFGHGLGFRSFMDEEFDEDHRLESFLIKYEEDLKFKAFYGGIESPSYTGKNDIAYGADLEAPIFGALRLGVSAIGYRNLQAMNRYAFRDVYAARALYSGGNLDLYMEYLESERYHSAAGRRLGDAIYANLDYLVGIFQIGGAYKKYDDFNYRLNDLPMANYHDESLSDALPGGMDEEGWQARLSVYPADGVSLAADYAEAWNSAKDKKMNDLYLEASLQGAADWILSYSQIEKLDDAAQNWQKEYYPALSVRFDAFQKPIKLLGEFKTVEKESLNNDSRHFEPKLQMDLGWGKIELSMLVSSHWQEFSEVFASRYRPGIELKYPLFDHSDIILFAGKEAGGKVCRNGSCRFVAPFEGVKLELISRF